MIRIDIQKAFSSAFHLDVQLDIELGQFVALYGPSGAGKTSILNTIAGITTPDAGQISYGDETWSTDSKILVKPERRGVGYLFQDGGLYPNMTALQNIQYANDATDSAYLKELFTTLDLKSLQQAYPNALSGGQKQRVALARALYQRPAILLLDEPFSGLEYDLKSQLMDYLESLHKRYDITTILVSHDEEVVMRLADTVHRVINGSIAESGGQEIVSQNTLLKPDRFKVKLLHVSKEEGKRVGTALINHQTVHFSLNGEHAHAQPGDVIEVSLEA